MARAAPGLLQDGAGSTAAGRGSCYKGSSSISGGSGGSGLVGRGPGGAWQGRAGRVCRAGKGRVRGTGVLPAVCSVAAVRNGCCHDACASVLMAALCWDQAVRGASASGSGAPVGAAAGWGRVRGTGDKGGGRDPTGGTLH